MNNGTTNFPRVPGKCHSIIDRNTKAVLNIRAGNTTAALSELRAALTQMKNDRSIPLTASSKLVQQAQDDLRIGEIDEVSIGGGARVPLLSLFSVSVLPDSPMPIQVDIAHWPLFDRAIGIGSDTLIQGYHQNLATKRQSQHVTLGVLLYNMALSYHLTATATKEYSIALRFYQMALSLFPENASVIRQEDCQNQAVLVCAIINNMASIHVRFFQVNEAERCIDCLREIIDDCNGLGANPSFMGEEDYLFFYLLLRVTAPDCVFAIAPAA